MNDETALPGRPATTTTSTAPHSNRKGGRQQEWLGLSLATDKMLAHLRRRDGARRRVAA
jgi:hypothetical protein